MRHIKKFNESTESDHKIYNYILNEVRDVIEGFVLKDSVIVLNEMTSKIDGVILMYFKDDFIPKDSDIIDLNKSLSRSKYSIRSVEYDSEKERLYFLLLDYKLKDCKIIEDLKFINHNFLEGVKRALISTNKVEISVLDANANNILNSNWEVYDSYTEDAYKFNNKITANLHLIALQVNGSSYISDFA